MITKRIELAAPEQATCIRPLSAALAGACGSVASAVLQVSLAGIILFPFSSFAPLLILDMHFLDSHSSQWTASPVLQVSLQSCLLLCS